MQVWYFCITLLDVCWCLKMYCVNSHTHTQSVHSLNAEFVCCIYVNASLSPQWSCRACWTTTWGHVSLPKYVWYVWENGQAWYGHDLLEQEQLLAMCLSSWMHTVKWCRPGEQPFDWDWCVFCKRTVTSWCVIPGMEMDTFFPSQPCVPKCIEQSSCLHHASVVSKYFFIIPTDAHYYKIVEMLKQFKTS
jgi:hypothetical protein